jgi:hypothetical protein
MKFFAISSIVLLSLINNVSAVWETVIQDSLTDYTTFEKYWDYLYPWGSDHNGSARMYGASDDHNHVYLKENTIVLKASRINWDEGKSTANPHPVIRYHSGAIHSKQTFTINDEFPNYEIKGEFIVPTSGGTWPAFWLNGAWTWPPEIDIVEFKGNNVNWFNTFRTSSDVSTYKESVSNAGAWHEYRVWITKVDNTNMDIHFYIDGKWKAKHTANHVGKPFHLIMNLQMEGSSGGNGPSGDTYYRGRNIYVGRSHECTGNNCNANNAVPTTTQKTTTTTKAQATTNNNENNCFSYPAYPCCKGNVVVYTDNDGSWGVENGDWCGISAANAATATNCWSQKLGYKCCNGCNVVTTDESGKWGVENNEWCGITC